MDAMLSMPFETIYNKPEEGRKPKTSGKEFFKYITGQSKCTMPSVIISTFQYAASKVPKSRKSQLQKKRQELKSEFTRFLGDNGVLLYPSFPSSANNHFEIYYKLVDATFLMVFNTLGLPVTQVHTGEVLNI